MEVEVNRKDQVVLYRVNGKLEAFHCNKILGESSRVFMPYVEMYNIHDVLEWVDGYVQTKS